MGVATLIKTLAAFEASAKGSIEKKQEERKRYIEGGHDEVIAETLLGRH